MGHTTRTLAPLALAMVGQGCALFFLLPALPRPWLFAYAVLCALLLAWVGRQRLVEQRAVEALAAQLLALSPTDSGGLPDRAVGTRGPLPDAVRRLCERLSETLRKTHALRDEAEEAGVYRTAFLRAVAHELRTPLNGILGFTDILLSGLEGPVSPDRRENLEVISQSGRRLLSLFNDAIELSAMASGQLSLRREPVDMAELLDAAAESLTAALGLRPIHIRALYPTPPPVIEGQRDKLLRTFEILGQVALERTTAGHVELEVLKGADAAHVICLLRDSGEPFAPDAHHLLTAPELAHSPEERRTALRLAIAEQLVHLHGGQLRIADGGEGVRFVVDLPVVAPGGAQ